MTGSFRGLLLALPLLGCSEAAEPSSSADDGAASGSTSGSGGTAEVGGTSGSSAQGGNTTNSGGSSTGGGSAGAGGGNAGNAAEGDSTTGGSPPTAGTGSGAAGGSGGALGSGDRPSGGRGGDGGAPTGGTAPTGGAGPELPEGGPPLAFVGAEGFGRETSGGRGGQVVHVTNLDDSGPGSFRDAVSQPGRIVVFDVGGVITVGERIVLKRNITVAGQTAPGDGITLYGNGIALNGDSGNDVVRYLRIRMGKNGDSGKDAVSISEGQNYMFDHVSISWGRDGTLDVNGSGIDNLSFQDTIIAQGINNSNHSTGGLMQSGRWSVIRCLYIDNKTRNPKARGTHEFINSVLYNWGTNGYIMGDTGGVSEANLVGNYFIYGPSSDTDTHITGTTPSFFVFASDNLRDSNRNGLLDGQLLTDFKTATVVPQPFDYPAGTEGKFAATEALNYVAENAGASLVRDAVDELLIGQLLSFGTQGRVIDTEDDNDIPGNVGAVASGASPRDFDQDGMPDGWETERGLDPNAPDDTGDDDGDGYTNIEEYLSCLAGEGDCSEVSSGPP